MAGQLDEMEELCKKSPLPIALDEELVGKDFETNRKTIEKIKPHFLILKPSLMGGFLSSQKLIELADKQGIGWWITSALESSIGLNAVAQFTAQYPISTPQGLGTGQIYTDNIESPLFIENGELKLDPRLYWEGEKKADEDEAYFR
jgi:O-succinylbenzoate synthase